MKMKKLSERERKEQEEMAREKQSLGAKYLIHSAVGGGQVWGLLCPQIQHCRHLNFSTVSVTI